MCGRPPLTNHYTQVAAAYPLYDDAGNLTKDPQGYEYGYDYENRIVDVNRPDHTPIAHFVYDAPWQADKEGRLTCFCK